MLTVATMDMLETVRPDSVDLVISPRSLMKPVRDHFAETPITGVTLIPDEATRVSLASLSTDAEIVGYSYFDTFVTLMKAGIRRFGPHITDLTMVVRGEPGVDEAIGRADVLVYATGAEYLLEMLRPDQHAFEYRHTPDIYSVRKELLPTIEAYRTKFLKKRRHDDEDFRKQLV